MEEGSSRLRGRGRRYSVAVFLIDDGDDAVFINHALSDTGGIVHLSGRQFSFGRRQMQKKRI